MNRFNLYTKPLTWLMALLLAGLAVGCGGGSGDPILGAGIVPPLTAATLTDVIKPRVAATYPLDLGVIAPANAPITATFSEAMDLATMIAANFTVVNTTTPGAVVPTAVNYDAASKTMTFTHLGLTVGDSYTATITTGATDVALNPLAGGLVGAVNPTITANYVWTFTATAVDAIAPTFTLTSPADLDNPVPLNTSVNITFSEAMDPTTLCSAVTLTCPAISITLEPTLSLGTFIAGAVTYDPASRI
ncbi:MAG: Ig-like domain-containing protein, partial [Actinomycetota bacterium]|nr:Ig-like domain-containing protein [Actinomycetota bacterium]